MGAGLAFFLIGATIALVGFVREVRKPDYRTNRNWAVMGIGAFVAFVGAGVWGFNAAAALAGK